MFAAPREIVAEIHAVLPEELRLPGRLSPWLKKKGRPSAHSFLEGPSFDRAGNLYTVDVAHGRIFRIAPDGTFTVFAQYEGEPNGLKIHRDGRIFVADTMHGILCFDPETGTRTSIVAAAPDGAFKGPNDLIFAANGDLYFTDQGETGYHDPTGGLYRLSTGGELVRILGNAPSPNGLVLTPSEDTVLLAVTRDNAVWRVPFRNSGEAYKVGKFIQLSGGIGSGPDGLAMDEEEGLAVAHAGLGTVWVFDRLGQPAIRIRSPVGLLVTNLAYGGPDRRTLFITEASSGTVLKATLPVAGRPLFSHA